MILNSNLHRISTAETAMLNIYVTHTIEVAMLEKEIEQHLRKEVIRAGGMCKKWVCPGHAGVPDRIVMLNNQIWFIELKRPGGRLSRLQKEFHKDIRKYTNNVMVIDSKEVIDGLIQIIMEMPK